MSRNGSGTYAAPAADFPAVAATIIESAKYNNVINDIATAMSGSIAADGQTTVTANLPMNSKKFTGLANGSARTDSPALGQVQDGTLNWVDSGGTANAITATYVPTITALVDGQICCVRATGANTITAPTFAPNGLTARIIYKVGGTALVAGDISGVDHELQLRYKLATTRWELLNPNTTNTAVVDAAADTTTWPLLATSQTGSQAPATDAGLTYNASTNALTTTTFIGALTGNADTATTAGTVSTTVASGAVGTTQTAGDNSTKIATTAYVDTRNITLGAEQASTSGTSIDFTGIPSWAKRINIMFSGVSTSGADAILVQLGDSGGIETTGYLGTASIIGVNSVLYTASFAVDTGGAAASVRHGTATLTLEAASAFRWAFFALLGRSDTALLTGGAGVKATSAALDRVRITTLNGTDTFDAGVINISYD